MSKVYYAIHIKSSIKLFMKKYLEVHTKKRVLVGSAIVCICVAGGWGIYSHIALQKQAAILEEHIAHMRVMQDALMQRLIQAQNEGRDLSEALNIEQNKNSEFEKQITDISSTVGTLDKLSKTDEELLAKYSRVYFLNENYIPQKLSQIPQEFVYSKGKDIYVHAQMLPFLVSLMRAARESNNELFVASGYRSFDAQGGIKSSYTVRYGGGANSFSADQGYSEHQLGTTVDVTTRDIGAKLTGFEKTKAYTWLMDNAYRYGFILSYPEKNEFYIFEPWHWRFVGTKLARMLHEEGKRFYDLDQRDIQTYLVSLFD